MLKRLLVLLLLPGFAVAAAPTAADEILAVFQTRIAQDGSFDDLLTAVVSLPGPEQRRLVGEIDNAWTRLRDAYLKQLAATANGMSSKQGDARQEIRKHRDAFREVYAKDEDTMKPLLHSVSMPAVEALRKLLAPDLALIMAAGGEPLKAKRKVLASVGAFRDGVRNITLSTKPMDAASSLEAAEKATAQEICGFTRDDLKILAQNRKIAADQSVPEAEARGIEECNELRMLVGLRALMIDPKLCEAGRDHAKDMQEKGFFAHESPVAGKKTPWDRARNFGTSASGENIFMGSPDPHAANMGWFYSPGHHKNMFNPGQLRMGLGNTGTHWTQMFGT